MCRITYTYSSHTKHKKLNVVCEVAKLRTNEMTTHKKTKKTINLCIKNRNNKKTIAEHSEVVQ